MKSIHNYRDLSLNHLSIMYRSEEQYITYLRVFGHKARTPALRDLLMELMHAAYMKQEWMNTIFASMKAHPLRLSSEGINGIFKEGFKLLHEDDKPTLADATMMHTLVLTSYYKLGNYRTLLLYFHSLEFSEQAEQLQKIINAEENSLKKISRLISDDYLLNVLDPHHKETLLL
ncbi:MAG: DUF892 family protein [Cyclobacteriaceae bacterium]